MHSVLSFFKNKAGDEEQSGINMVDLMMWLVIAALLLASAIQGIGYYQQNANVYSMKSAVDVAKSRIMAVAANDGSIDIEDVDTIVAEENAERNTDEITLSVGTIALTAAGEPGGNDSGFELASVATATTVPAGETYYIRAVHAGVSKYDVIHLFKDITSKKEGTHLVDKGTTGPATPGGGTPSPSPTATPSPSATTTPSPTATATPTPSTTPTPTPTPTPTATRPADTNAAGNIVQASGYGAWWGDRSVQSMASGVTAYFGFAISGVTAPATSNYTVEFTGSPEIGVKSTQTAVFQNANGGMWYAAITPVTGGFTEGVGYVTAKVTNNTTGAVSMKSWQLTVTPQVGMTQSSYYSSYWTDKTANSMASGANGLFGFEIKGAVAGDYDVTFTGDPSIGAKDAVGTFTNQAGSDWYAYISPVAGGFTEGVGTITAKATHKVTGKSFTKTYKLTVVPHPGISQSSYYHAWFTDKTANSNASSTSVPFGFEIKGAVDNDYTVVFSGGQNVGVAANPAAIFTNYAGSDWYANITPVAGGFKVGTDTITATATHKLTGRVFTKTYNLTVVEHPGITAGSYYGAWFLDRTVAVGSATNPYLGFQISGAVANDYTVTFTGGDEINAQTTGATYTNYSGSYDWYTNLAPKAGGKYTAGVATITATATHKLTGKVYTKTFKVTAS